MKKKLLVLALAALMIFAFASCGNDESTSDNSESQGIAKEDIKVGFVYIGAIGDEGWTDSHNDGRLYLEEELGVETAYMENVTEDSGCEDAIRNLIDQGCNVIFTTSFGFGEWTQKVALDHPDLYPELGPEAVRRLEVEDFPVTVINDVHGNDLYEAAIEQYNTENV